GPSLNATHAAPAAAVREFLQRIAHPFSEQLIRQLDKLARASIDRTFLISFGRFWSDASESPLLIEPAPWGDALAAAESATLNTPPRPLLVSGDQRVGKTAFLRLLAQRLAERGWSEFEASGADLMAGQQWFAQLLGRIQLA